MTVLGEFCADRAVGTNDIVEGAVHQVNNDGTALDVPEEASADPGPLARALDQSGKVGQDKLAVVQPHDPELRLQRRERVVGDFRPGMSDGCEEGRLAGVGEAD